MNTDVMFSSKTDLWATPQNFLIISIKSLISTLMCVRCQKMQSVKTTTVQRLMDSPSGGGDVYGVIHHTVEKLQSGCEKVLSPYKLEQLRYV